jgi:S-formylglutathione hydrolase FrmB
MALFHSHFFSETLGMQCQAEVIIPQPASSENIGVHSSNQREHWPCVWLLHGLSDDHTIWTRRTSIERYAEERGIAVVMPNVHRSFYTDMVYGADYYTFLTEELPATMRRFFPLSSRREDNAAAGLSMGGYGALKWALDRPDQLMAGVSLSGALDIERRIRILQQETDETAKRRQTLHLVYNSTIPDQAPDNLFRLLDLRAQDGTCPPFRIWCGTEDFLYEDNIAFHGAAEKLNLPLTYTEGPGDHSWGHWDREIVPSLDWLLEQGLGQ